MKQVLDDLGREIAGHFKPGFLQRDRTVFQFHFEQGEPFHLVVTETAFEFETGEIADPTVTLYLDRHETCFALIRGREDGMRAFMEERYRANGNIVLSQLLLYLFKPDDPTTHYDVED